MAWLYYLLLFVFELAGIAITVMTLPGLWLMLASAAVYALLTHGNYIGWWTLATLLVLATVAEIIEFTSSGAGAKRAGGGRAGIWGAIIGGIVGGIVLSFFIPIPVFGTLVGVCLGTFLGAMIGEFAFGREITHSLKIGFGAAKGRLFGTFIKLGFGCVMLVITMGVGLPIGGRKPAGATGVVPVRISPPITTQAAR
jgi:uncharacterized protein YqgC (DUF456 family)